MEKIVSLMTNKIMPSPRRKRRQITTTISDQDRLFLSDRGIKIADALKFGVFSLRCNENRRHELAKVMINAESLDCLWHGRGRGFNSRPVHISVFCLTGCTAPNQFYKLLRRGKNKVSVSLSGEEIEKLIKMVVDLSLPVKQVADLQGITASRVYQLVKSYRQSGVYPLPQKRGRPAVVVSSSVRLEIIPSQSPLRLGTL